MEIGELIFINIHAHGDQRINIYSYSHPRRSANQYLLIFMPTEIGELIFINIHAHGDQQINIY